jgi:hypothetical protein
VKLSEILGFRALSIVLVLKNKLRKNTTFRKLDLFPSSGDGKTYSVGSLLALSKGPNRIGFSLHLRAETDPVSETSCFSLVCILIPGRWIKPENPISLKDK